MLLFSDISLPLGVHHQPVISTINAATGKSQPLQFFKDEKSSKRIYARQQQREAIDRQAVNHLPGFD
ncbi:MAG: hypothetical protein RBR42_12140 [Desulfomicrobium sp.]|nr:hypothetical protein [Desulfomicrobium sp.]